MFFFDSLIKWSRIQTYSDVSILLGSPHESTGPFNCSFSWAITRCSTRSANSFLIFSLRLLLTALIRDITGVTEGSTSKCAVPDRVSILSSKTSLKSLSGESMTMVFTHSKFCSFTDTKPIARHAFKLNRGARSCDTMTKQTGYRVLLCNQ